MLEPQPAVPQPSDASADMGSLVELGLAEPDPEPPTPETDPTLPTTEDAN
jgi:hypothetical protein